MIAIRPRRRRIRSEERIRVQERTKAEEKAARRRARRTDGVEGESADLIVPSSRRRTFWAGRKTRIVAPLALALGAAQVALPGLYVVPAVAVLGARWVWVCRTPRTRRAAAAVVALAAWWLLMPSIPGMWRIPVPAIPFVHDPRVPVPHDVLRWAALIPAAVAVRIARARHFRIRPVELDLADTSIEDIWDERIAKKHLPESVLRPPEPVYAEDGVTELGVRARFDLKPGGNHYGQVRALAPTIASAYLLGLEDVILDGVERNQSAGYLTLLNNLDLANPLLETHEMIKPRFDVATGTAVLGIRGDLADASLQVYDQEHGARQIWVNGSIGSGKSGFMDTLLATVCSGGVTLPFFIDMKSGTSLADWRDVGGAYVTDSETAVAVLEGIVRLGDYRLWELSRMHVYDDEGRDRGSRKVVPVGEDYPHILLVLEECPQLWEEQGKTALKLAEKIVRLFRAAMVTIVFVSQDTTLQGAFKDSGVIRKQVQAGAVAAFANDPDSGSQAFGNRLKVDLSKIPTGYPGLGFMASTVDARDSMMRTLWTRYPIDHARAARIPRLPPGQWAALNASRPTVEGAAALAPWVDLGGDAGQPGEATPLHAAMTADQVKAAVLDKTRKAGGRIKRAELAAQIPGASSDQIGRAAKAVLADAGFGYYELQTQEQAS